MKVIKSKYVRLITATFCYYYKHKFNCIKYLCNCHSLLQFHLNFITIKNSSFNSTIVYYLYIFASTSSLQFFQPYCDALACTFYTLSISAVFTVLHQSYFLNFSFIAPMFFLFLLFNIRPY